MYNVFLSVKGDETLVYRGAFKKVNEYEDALRDQIRAQDPDGDELDCYVISDEQIEKRVAAIEKWEHLTEEEKNDYVTVGGWKYIRAVYDAMHLIKSR